MKNVPFSHHFSVLVFWAFCTFNVQSQGKINITAGIGIPESINVGVRYPYRQLQFGVSAGSDGHDLFSYTADVFYIFGTLPEIPKKNPWVGRLGYSYLRESNEYAIDKLMTLQARFGKLIEINSRLGIGLDAGLMFKVYEDHISIKPKPSTGWNIHFNFGILEYVLPSSGLYVYYKL